MSTNKEIVSDALKYVTQKTAVSLSLFTEIEERGGICFSNGKSLLQLWLVVSPSLSHQGSLPGATLHEHPFH